MTEYASFRQRLDGVLRTLDVKRVQEFLVSEGQWSDGTPADPEFAMWIMIASSPTLSAFHAQAQTWLSTHGHEEEAQAIVGRQKKSQAGKKSGGGQRRPSSSSRSASVTKAAPGRNREKDRRQGR